MTSETDKRDLPTSEQREDNVTLLSPPGETRPLRLPSDGDHLGEALPWPSRPGPPKIQVFMHPFV